MRVSETYFFFLWPYWLYNIGEQKVIGSVYVKHLMLESVARFYDRRMSLEGYVDTRCFDGVGLCMWMCIRFLLLVIIRE